MAADYELDVELARGGMASIHLARMKDAGFSRTVAIKRLQPQFAADPEFVELFVDEARLATRLKHPNLVAVLDVVASKGELLLVMDYVSGATVHRLPSPVPPPIAVAIALDALHGLHSAHEARDEQGRAMNLVHRDVSPDNLIVGADGVTRVLDFGVAKASNSVHVTRDGRVKGKLAYASPEQLRGQPATPRSDVYSLSVVLWEMLTGRRLIAGDHESAIVEAVLLGPIEAPRISPALDALVLKGLGRRPEQRFESAAAMAEQLTQALEPATRVQVGAWVRAQAGPRLQQEQEWVQRLAARAPAAVPAAQPDAKTEPVYDVEPTELITSRTQRVDPPKWRWWWLAGPAVLALLGYLLFAFSR
ncbi:MAG: serine/threonine-protein kinase [Myxococcaceae bacterium]